MIQIHGKNDIKEQKKTKDKEQNNRERNIPGYKTAYSYAYDLLKKFSKDNRRYPTESESILWSLLRRKQLGVRFRRQHPVEGYIPDFVCLPCQLIIEVDGGYHYIDGQQISDEERTNYLEAKGYHVLRFTNEEVIATPEKVLAHIKDELNKRIKMTEQNNTLQNFTKPLQTNQQPLAPVDAPLLGRGRGRLLIFSAPSGSGKSTIVQWLMKEHPELNLHFSISCTSRAPRGTEQNGVEYFFLTPEEFKQKIANGEFLEYEEVYKDRFYGTLKSQVEDQIERGENVVFDVDVKGGCNIKQFYGDRAMSIFVQPPSIEELRRRLNGRGTDLPEVIEQRLAKANYELSFAPKFDHIVVNDDLETAKQETHKLLISFLNNR